MANIQLVPQQIPSCCTSSYHFGGHDLQDPHVHNYNCVSNDAHQRHRTGFKFTGNAYTHKCFIICPQLIDYCLHV